MNLKKKNSLFIAILLLFLFLFPSISFAHAYILKSSPIENETLENSPGQVTIQFDETIQPKFNSIQVFNSKGDRVDQKNGKIDPNQPSILKTGIKNNLPYGTYRIQWRVVSNDGHPVDGVIPFQIGSENATENPVLGNNETKGYTPKTDLVVLRWLQYIGNACYVGLFFFYLIVLPKGIKQIRSVEKVLLRIMSTGLILLFVSILLNLPLQATIVSGLPWSKVFSFSTFGQVLSSTWFGQTGLIQLALLLILAITTYFFRVADKTKQVLSWACFGIGIGLLLTKSFTSHAASQPNQVLTISMDFLHLLAASVWIGSLMGMVALLPMLKQTETKPYFLTIIKRFSKWGIILVLLLAFTGVFGGFQYIPTLSSVIKTDYGNVLTTKVILFFVMLILAAMNFFKGRRGKEKGLVNSLWGEVIIGCLVLILTVILTNLPTSMSSPGPFYETNAVEQGNKVSLGVTPNRIGENTYKIMLKDSKGKSIKEIEQITLAFTSVDMAMGKDTVTLSKVGEGKYLAKGLNLNMSGNWSVHVHVLTKSLESMDTDFRLIVGSQ